MFFIRIMCIPAKKFVSVNFFGGRNFLNPLAHRASEYKNLLSPPVMAEYI